MSVEATLGTLFIVSAPSGAGKSSLIQALLQSQPAYDIRVAISHTTRAPRANERDGEHYHFVSQHQFSEMIQRDEFLEHAQVFGHCYGTAKSSVNHLLASGIDLFLDIDWQGARQIRQSWPLVRTIFILPPSVQELQRRLLGRGQDSPQVIADRMQQAINEMRHYAEYDYLLINDDFDLALADLKAIIRAERLQQQRQQLRHQDTIKKLLADE